MSDAASVAAEEKIYESVSKRVGAIRQELAKVRFMCFHL